MIYQPIARINGDDTNNSKFSTSLTAAIANGDALAVARSYVAAGLSVLPIGFNKQPAFSILPQVANPLSPTKTRGVWEPFQRRLATDSELREWYGGRHEVGIGAIGGPVSGNLAVLDFEKVSVYRRWRAMLTREDEEYLSRCPGVVTPGKVSQKESGIHLYVRLTEAVPGTEFVLPQSELENRSVRVSVIQRRYDYGKATSAF